MFGVAINYRPHPKDGEGNSFTLSIHTPGGVPTLDGGYLPWMGVPTLVGGWGGVPTFLDGGTYLGWWIGIPQGRYPLSKVGTPNQVRTGGTPR